MKKNLNVLMIFMLMGAIALPLACSKSSVTSPSLGFPTSTPGTPVSCGVSGVCASLDMEYDQGIGTAQVLNLTVAVNSLPYTTAGVTLNTPGGSVPMTFSSSSSTYSLYTAASAWTYVPNGVYTLNISTSLGSASASVTAPGGITHAADGSRSSWLYPGTYNYVDVWDSGGILFVDGVLSGNAVSPVNIPASTYSAVGTTYNINTDVHTNVAYAIGSTVINILARNVMWTTLTTATGTPTSTGTNTFTPTPGSPTATPTVTNTYTFTKTYTVTNTPTITYTPTNTSTPTDTPTPTSTPTPLPLTLPCSSDNTSSGFPASGTVTLSGLPLDFVPLCNGWILVGDPGNKQIDLMNVGDGAVSQKFTLSDAPGHMAFDPATSYLYVCLQSTCALARVNVATGAVVNISLADAVNNPNNDPATLLSLTPDGKVFAELAESGSDVWWNQPLALVDGTNGSLIKVYLAPGGLSAYGIPQGYVTYDSVRKQLIVSQLDQSPANIYTYPYNSASPSLNPTPSLTYNTANNIQGVAMSPDGNHLGVMEGGVGIVDYNPASISATTQGTWASGGIYYGVGGLGGAFSPDSSLYLTATGGTIQVYNVSSHTLATSYNLGLSVYQSIVWVGYSSGGHILYTLVNTNSPTSVDTIRWQVYP
jgi:hypothetical protein